LIVADGFSENLWLWYMYDGKTLNPLSLSLNPGDKYEFGDSYYSTTTFNGTAFLFVIST
jgi:hypothetical protein